MYYQNLYNKTFNLKCKEPSEYDSCEPYSVTLNPGRYIFECFGGSSAAASDSSLNGYGAHVSGIIALFRSRTFYIYVGGQGSSSFSGQKGKISPGGYNGGGNGGYGAYSPYTNCYKDSGTGGGGATDIRTVPGKWNDTKSLASRVMVAGAAGGWNVLNLKGGNGGGTSGQEAYDCNNNKIIGANTTTGFSLGAGQDGLSKDKYGEFGAEGNSGAGGGYYGGFASQKDGANSGAAGSGGSSFISGYNGLPIVSNIIFGKPTMIDGSSTKHLGNGVAFIVKINSYSQFQENVYTSHWIFICIYLISP